MTQKLSPNDAKWVAEARAQFIERVDGKEIAPMIKVEDLTPPQQSKLLKALLGSPKKDAEIARLSDEERATVAGREFRERELNKTLGRDRMLRLNNPVDTIAAVLAAVRAEATLAERESCAKVASDHVQAPGTGSVRSGIAAAIRARRP
jgi:hypothetical protein